MFRLVLPIVVFVLLLLGVAPTAARAEEVRAKVRHDPAEVGRLLLSADEAERTRGVALLNERIVEGGPDLGTFLRAMAEAQARWANDEKRLVTRWIELARTGTPDEKDRARRMLAASGPDAVQRLFQVFRDARKALAADAALPAPAAAVPVPQAPVLPQARGTKVAVPSGPPLPMVAPDRPEREEDAYPRSRPEAAKEAEVRLDWPVATQVLQVPKAEIDRWVANRDEALAPIVTGHAVVVPDTPSGTLARDVARLPDARVLDTRVGESAVRVSTVFLLEGSRFRYRRDLERKAKGAWAVTTDTLPRGLQVELRILDAEADRLRFAIEARNHEVPTPLPAIRLRPAPDVEPMEIDVPEWRVASMRTETEVDRRAPAPALLAFFPDLVEGQVVVVSVRVVGLEPAAAADAVPK